MALDKHMVLRTLLIFVAAVILFALISYYNTKQSTVASEKFYEQQMQSVSQPRPSAPPRAPMPSPSPSGGAAPLSAPPQPSSKAMPMPSDSVDPAEDNQQDEYRPVDFATKEVPTDCFPKDRLTAEDLLPSDANSKWAQVNPAGQGDVKNINFLSAGFHVGINTTSGSMKNANLQLRSEPPNPKGSWPIMNSSYTPSDLLRKPLEIGGDC